MDNKLDVLDAIFIIILMFNVKYENWSDEIKKYKSIKSNCFNNKGEKNEK